MHGRPESIFEGDDISFI